MSGPVDPQLNSTARRRLCAYIRSTEPNCHLCGRFIDLTLDRQRHPLSSTIDEILPRIHGGSAIDPYNTKHAHRCCNTSRGARPLTPVVYARCRALVLSILTPEVTSRTW